MKYCCRVLNAHLDSLLLVLGWIRSYLAERTQRMVYQDDISLLVWLLGGVPQGSVLGPLLFSAIYCRTLWRHRSPRSDIPLLRR